jgi:anti-anti-sigma regulatory factor
MASYAERAGCEFRLASPRPSVVKIMRITGLDRRFLASETPLPGRFLSERDGGGAVA